MKEQQVVGDLQKAADDKRRRPERGRSHKGSDRARLPIASTGATAARSASLTGIESDILADGSLDYRPEVLARFDFLVASVHSGFRLGRDERKARAAARTVYSDEIRRIHAVLTVVGGKIVYGEGDFASIPPASRYWSCLAA